MKAMLRSVGVTVNENTYLLGSLVKACQYKNDVIKHRLPLHKYMVNLLVAQCTTHFLRLNQIYLSKLYSAILATAYYGLLRISEIVTGTHPILAPDVHVGINKKKVLLVLRTSKTHWKNKKPQLIRINSNGSLTKQRNR